MSVPTFSPPGNGSGAASPTPAPHPLDALVNAVTAFDTWAELVERMAAGYVPTIRPTSRRRRLLCRAIQASGYASWPKPVEYILERGRIIRWGVSKPKAPPADPTRPIVMTGVVCFVCGATFVQSPVTPAGTRDIGCPNGCDRSFDFQAAVSVAVAKFAAARVAGAPLAIEAGSDE